jgi:hypothetical protein
MGKMLIDEPPILLSPALATLFGINKAAILQQLFYLLQQTEERQNQHNFADGNYWVYNTYEEWRSQYFKWLSASTIKNIFNELEREGIIVSRQGVKNVFDRCKWYRINHVCLAQKLSILSDKKSPIEKTKIVPSQQAKTVLLDETKIVLSQQVKTVPSLSKNQENLKESTKNLSPIGESANFARYWVCLTKYLICGQVVHQLQPTEQTKPSEPVQAPAPAPSGWKANSPEVQTAVADAFKVNPGGFAGTLALQLLGQKTGKRTKRDNFLIEPPMTPPEIVLFGGWYRDKFEFSPQPSTDAERIAELVAEFRSKPPHYFANNLPRAEAKLRKLMGQEKSAAAPMPDDAAYAERINQVYARLAALKGQL